jgi:hypothetical protein
MKPVVPPQLSAQAYGPLHSAVLAFAFLLTGAS